MNADNLLEALREKRVWVLAKRADGRPYRKITHLMDACIKYDDAIDRPYLSCEQKGLTLYPDNFGKRVLEYGQVWGLLKRRK